ncbi:MAG TPA: serine/threonine-protein kinase [Polyangiaceae bacterium]|nr:serine/threonine-protein kinase [Polyangiaceae bacterium]
MINSSPAKHLSSGSPLGRYELLLPIAKGGMAEVWAARLHGTRGFQKVVAIKTILSGAIDDARMEEMFLVEAEIASKIHHPNVVGTIDLGEHEGTLYLVMEWVDGESLNVLMQKAASQGGVPLPIGVNLIGQACQGLFAAHNLRDDQGELLGVVHRDVSPHNLLVTYSGTAKVVDFGIAKATSQASSTEAGEVKGKFAYMAPEQVRAQPVDARTDLFALGILLYQITTGKHPFRGENPAETLQNICAERPPIPPSAFLPDYPAELEAVVLKALAKNPARRFSTANEMLTALERAMPGPLEASFEVQVAEYLKQLFGPRATERRAALRVAQERVDQLRAESSSQISLGTLRAIAIDRMDGTGSSQISGRVSTPLLIRNTPTPTPIPAPRARSKQVFAALAGALAVVAGGLMLRLPSTSAGPQKAGSGGMVPVETIMPPNAKVAPPPVASVLQAAPSAAASIDADRASEPAKKAIREHKAPPRGGRPVATGSLSGAAAVPPTAAAPAVTAPATTIATATTAAASVGSPSTNTLGRGAFGGRH